MTALVDVANRALQFMGSRTTIASLSDGTNESNQIGLVITMLRDEILRMAPWNCAVNFINMTYITSMPGTPENPSSGTPLWQKGIPAPPWAYEYQYPVDCIRPLFIIPQYTTGFSGGVPITTAITGGVPNFWNGPPVRFKVSIDQFFSITGASPVNWAIGSAGSGYAVGDIVTLQSTPLAPQVAPIGAPAQFQVTSIGVGGSVGGLVPINVIQGELSNTPFAGSYFSTIAAGTPIGQGSTTGVGTGLTVLVNTWTPTDQRVILTNQEFATLGYIRQIQDPNVMDPQLIQAWASALGARICMQLNGDKQLANMLIQQANGFIMGARISDGNEGLTVNDITPDWIRIRGYDAIGPGILPDQPYDWGPLLTLY